jgi:hypothetical protein
MLKVALLTLAAGKLLRTPPHVLSADGGSHLEAFGGLAAALRKGTDECAAYVNATLKELATSYTHVQVPHVLEQQCASGTFFHAFKSKEECDDMSKKLIEAFKSDKPDYTEWCDEVEGLVGGSDGPETCECMSLPESIERVDGQVTATSGAKYPSAYGAECKAHDLETDSCKGEYKAAWCYEKWCYVKEGCEAKDVKKSFFFGEGTELKYSYNTCGGVDAYAAEACAANTEEEKCTGFSENCAWNKNGCQNKLCQCTGSNGGMDVAKYGFEAGYGETCKAWDKQSCAEYEEMGDGYSLGLWCCKDWCYVPGECPSAEKSAVGDGLFYSYFACPDDADELAQCAWKEPIDFGGDPVPLSSEAAEAVGDAAKAEAAA